MLTGSGTGSPTACHSFLSCPRPVLVDGLSGKTTGSSRPYLHRSAGCRGDGSRVCRNTGSCQCCFYISAGTGSPGTRPCLEGTGEAGARSPWRCGNMQSFLSHRRLLPHAGPGEAILTRSLCSHPCINSCPPCSAFPPPPLISSPSHLLQSSSSQCGAHTPQGQCDLWGQFENELLTVSFCTSSGSGGLVYICK